MLGRFRTSFAIRSGTQRHGRVRSGAQRTHSLHSQRTGSIDALLLPRMLVSRKGSAATKGRHQLLLTIEQAAERTGTTPRFMRRLIAERRIAYTKLGKFVRISSTDLDDFVTAGRVEAQRPGWPMSPSAAQR